jgi:hypothetical protein
MGDALVDAAIMPAARAAPKRTRTRQAKGLQELAAAV